MYYVIINEQYFPIRDELLDSVRDDLLESVRRGGAFVAFESGEPQQVEVLVTPSTPVRIQRVERPDHDVDDGMTSSTDDPESPASDVDWWLEWS